MAARRIAEAVLTLSETLPEFDGAFLARVEAEARARRSARTEALQRLDEELKQVDRELTNISDAVVKMSLSPTLQSRLGETERRKARLEDQQADLLRLPDEVPELPTIIELKRLAREAVGRMAFDDPEFGRVMHRLVPRIEVFPHRLLDGGAIVLRAELTVNLAPLLGAAGDLVNSLIVRTMIIDLFDPPQRVAFREAVVALRGQGMTERETAGRMELTVTAAQRAMALHRQMQEVGANDPYQRLVGPPDGDGKLRRHNHPRYRFQPLVHSPTLIAPVTA
jgi:hypothetical protein